MKEREEGYEAYPLAWPQGYRRHVERIHSKFHRRHTPEGSTWQQNRPITLFEARNELRRQVELLAGKTADLIISTNMKTRKSDGDVYSDAREPDDPGVAIYFKFKGASRCLCADQYRTVKENTYALAMTIDSMRAIERWGASDMLDRMFTGFKALPSPADVRWWEILGVPREASFDTVRSAYRKKLMNAHPDRNDDSSGSDAERTSLISSIESAWNHAKAEKGVG